MILEQKELFLSDYVPKTQKAFFKHLKDFEDFLTQEGVPSMGEIKKIHLTQYARGVINQKKTVLKNKRRIFHVIIKYLHFLAENELIPNEISITAPNFTKYISDESIKRNNTPRAKEDEIRLLLEHAAKVNPMMFIYLALITHNGMRDSECRSIKIEFIDFNLKMITTGVVEEHKKEGICYYCIPERLISVLKRYIAKLQLTFNHPVYLFHSPSSKLGFLSATSIKKNLRKYADILGITKRVNPHTYRHSINFYRLKNECDGALMAILENQVPKGTNAQYYTDMIEDEPQVRYDLWKKYTWDLIPAAIDQIINI
jgi:site-specific recombinase XerD